MQTTLACIGFTEPTGLAELVETQGSAYHGQSSTRKWEDASGALLLLDRAGVPRPSFRSALKQSYNLVEFHSTGAAIVHFAQEDADNLPPVIISPHCRYATGWAFAGKLSLSVLGQGLNFYPNADHFRARSPLADKLPAPDPRNPQDLPKPLLLTASGDDQPTALFVGIIISAEERTNQNSRAPFMVCRAQSVVGEVEIAAPMPFGDMPEAGAVVAGIVTLTARMPVHGGPDDSASAAGDDSAELRTVETELVSDDTLTNLRKATEEEAKPAPNYGGNTADSFAPSSAETVTEDSEKTDSDQTAQISTAERAAVLRDVTDRTALDYHFDDDPILSETASDKDSAAEESSDVADNLAVEDAAEEDGSDLIAEAEALIAETEDNSAADSTDPQLEAALASISAENPAEEEAEESSDEPEPEAEPEPEPEPEPELDLTNPDPLPGETRREWRERVAKLGK